MTKKTIREWKKVFKSDLPYIVYELKELTKSPAMVIIDGEMGAGKTTFCQTFIGDSEVFSPTYSLLSECKGVLHADLYRLEKQEDLMALEVALYLEDKQWFLVEWGGKFSKRLFREIPENWSTYSLDVLMNNGHGTDEGPSRNFVLSAVTED